MSETRYGPEDSEVSVFTFKEGLLSAIAHDLELRVERFEISLSAARDRVEASFDPRTIRVVDAIVDGRRSPGTLSDKDKAKIESNVVKDVIDVRRGPQVRFTSSAVEATPAGLRVVGTLELSGRSRSLTVEAREDGDHFVVETRLHQPDFGIKPYSAMLGALKIKPDIDVRLRFPRST